MVRSTMRERANVDSAVIAPAAGAQWGRILGGAGASGAGQIIAFLQAVCLVPLFIGAWGVVGYGRWVTLTSFVAYLGLIEFGGQPYIANLVAAAHAKRDDMKIAVMLSDATSFFACLGAAALLLLAPALANFHSADAWVLGCMASVTLLFGIPVGIYLTAYRGTGLFARGMMLGNLLRLLGLGVSAAALWTGISLKGYALAMLGVAALQTLAIVWDARRLIPACREVTVSVPAAVRGRAYLTGSIYCWLIAVAQALMQQGLILILSLYASSASVAMYFTHRTLASISGYASLLLLGPVLPELAFLCANDRFSEVQNVTILAIKVLVLATGTLAAVIWLIAPLIYPHWTGKQLNIDSILLFVLLFQGVLSAAWTTAAWGLLATNRFRPMAGWYLANAVVTMGLALWWVKDHGLVGVAFASLIGDVACGLIVFPALAASFLKIPRLKLFSAMLAAVGALAPVLLAAAASERVTHGWRLVALFLLAAPFWGYLSLRMAFGKEEILDALKKLQGGVAVRFGWGT